MYYIYYIKLLNAEYKMKYIYINFYKLIEWPTKYKIIYIKIYIKLIIKI